MKRKIFLASYYYKPHSGGVENSLYYLSRAYREEGYDVCIISSDADVTKKSRLSKNAYEDDVQIYRFRRFIPFSILFHFLAPVIDVWRAYNLFKIIQRKNPEGEVIIINRHYITALASAFAGFKYVLYLLPGVVKTQDTISLRHNFNLKSWLINQYIRFLIIPQNHYIQKRALAKCEKLFVFSQNMKEQLESVLKFKAGHIRVVKPGVDIGRFSKLNREIYRQRLSIACADRVFLCFGRITVHKGFALAVEAFARLSSQNVKLLIVGDGPVKRELQTLVKRLAMESKVCFFSATNEPELYYRASDIFLMTSLHETFGQTIIEAGACELPVIAFEKSEIVHTATHEIIRPDKNFFCECSVEKLVETMEYALSMGKEELEAKGKANREHIMVEYSWNALAEELLRA